MTRALIAAPAWASITQDIAPMEEAKPTENSLSKRLKEQLESMTKFRRGLTVDSGAADHVLPTSWLTWIVLTMSLGVVIGPDYG